MQIHSYDHCIKSHLSGAGGKNNQRLHLPTLKNEKTTIFLADTGHLLAPRAHRDTRDIRLLIHLFSLSTGDREVPPSEIFIESIRDYGATQSVSSLVRAARVIFHASLASRIRISASSRLSRCTYISEKQRCTVARDT